MRLRAPSREGPFRNASPVATALGPGQIDPAERGGTTGRAEGRRQTTAATAPSCRYVELPRARLRRDVVSPLLFCGGVIPPDSRPPGVPDRQRRSMLWTVSGAGALGERACRGERARSDRESPPRNSFM